MSEPQVYLNGEKVGEWAYGYSYFYFDVSYLIREGENTLAMQVSNMEYASRWYPGAGLYRKVSLISKNHTFLEGDFGLPLKGAFKGLVQKSNFC